MADPHHRDANDLSGSPEQPLIREGVPYTEAEPLMTRAVVEAELGTSPPSPRASTLEELRGYFERHRERYERAALRDNVIRDGHSLPLVDLAQAQVYGFDVRASAPTRPVSVSGSGVALGLTLAGVLVLNYLVAPILAVGLLFRDSVALALLVLLIVPAELVAWLALRRRQRAVGRGILWGLVGSLPIIAGALLLIGLMFTILADT